MDDVFFDEIIEDYGDRLFEEQPARESVGLSDLLACPFCGGKATVNPLWANDNNPKKYRWFYPTCLTEGCPGVIVEDGEMGGTTCDCKTVEDAIKLWNTRAR